MELIVITPEETLEDEPELVGRLLENGLQRLHIRKPGFTEYDYRDYILAIREKYHSRIVIHDHFRLYGELKLNGIHLNSAMRSDSLILTEVAAIPPSRISTSFHSWQEIADNHFKYRYVFISPVFDSFSKPGYKGAIDLEGAMKTKKLLSTQNRYCPKLIGLGGVGPQQLKALSKIGFDGAAMLGAIWNSEFPLVMFLESLVQIRSL